MAWAPGERLGPYEIGPLIGRGGMGEVFRAHYSRLNRTVAVKRVTARSGERFRAEPHAVAALNHPHIGQIFDVGSDYLVLEDVDGEPLRRPVAVEEAVRLSLQIADALAAAHARGIIHRDLKPANVVVRRDAGTSTIKLLDFGVSASVADVHSTPTADGDIVGTPAYMSPEQACGSPPDARSDVFSFGAPAGTSPVGPAFGADEAVVVESRRRTSLEGAPDGSARAPGSPTPDRASRRALPRRSPEEAAFR